MAGNQRRRAIKKTPLAIALPVAAGLALVSICLEYGFDQPPLPQAVLLACQIVAVALYLADLVRFLITARQRWTALRTRALDIGLVFGAALAVLVLFEFGHLPVLRATAISVVLVQVLLAVRFGIGAIRFNLELSQRGMRPAKLLVLSFLVLIVVGGLLLALPKAMTPEHRHEHGAHEAQRILNSFFTSVSATCVTGLVVYDTGADYTRFGQCVILGLIQLGGLGIMILGSLFGLLVGRNLSLRQSLVLQDALSHQTVGQVGRMVRFILAATILCELGGAVLLYPMWRESVAAIGDRVFYSVFHSVSAFCNAGFALQSDSLVGYHGAWQAYAIVMPLIVLGGLGFPVLDDLHRAFRAWLARWWHRWRARRASTLVLRPGPSKHRFTLHSKIVLWATAFLIVVPALGLLLFESAPEWRSRRQIDLAGMRARAEGQVSVMADLPPADRAMAALFQSVTARTAGFNTVPMDVDSLSPASRFLLSLLMFIGGSPASTAGGVKTVGVAVLLLGIVATLRGRENIEFLGRSIPVVVLRRASVVVVVMFLVVGLLTLALCYTEREPLPRVLFETVSACGTVGLSTGLTGELTVPGRLIIMVAMFVGRLGPLTVLVALAGRPSSARYEYPEEQPIIG